MPTKIQFSKLVFIFNKIAYIIKFKDRLKNSYLIIY
jgi:hypothetical protein